MKKVTTLAAAALAALAFTACTSNNGGTPEENAISYASVRVDLDATRAINDPDQVDNNGTTEESTVSSMELVGLGATWATADITAAGNVYTGKAKPVTKTGSVTTALVVNGNGLTTSTAIDATYGGTDVVAEIAKLSTDNSFVMTSDLAGKTIAPNISEADAPTKNLIDFGNVERVVAKGIVQKGAALTAEVTDGKGSVQLDDITYSAVNGATKTYIYHNQAGERTMGVDDPNQYAGFKSAIHDIAPKEDAAEAFAAGMIRLGEISTDKDQLGGYAAKDVVDPTVTDLSGTPGVKEGIYFLENSGEATAANKVDGFYRFAYAKIYATFVPTEVLEADKTAKGEFVAKAGTGKWFVKDAEGVYTDADKTADGAEEGYLVYPLKKSETYAAGTTFVKGAEDGVFYLDATAAASSKTNPGQKCWTYNNGRCGYRALWNRQSPDDNLKLVNNASARRNNIYVLNVTAFETIGMPWDPSDPNDPNLPKVDPNDPDYPDNPNIEDQDSYVAVKATVLPWNVVGRDVILK